MSDRVESKDQVSATLIKGDAPVAEAQPVAAGTTATVVPPTVEDYAEEKHPKKKRPPFERREFFEALLKQAESLRLLVDGRDYGVVLPKDLHDGLVALHYGKNLPHPPEDLTVDEWGVRATLAFSDGDHLTAIPWDAVVEVSDMEHFVWQDRRRMEEFKVEAARNLPPKYTKRGDKARRRLKLLH